MLEIGRVNRYFARIGVAGIDPTGNLAIGDTIRIEGHSTDLTQDAQSMQIDRQGDHVYKVTD